MRRLEHTFQRLEAVRHMLPDVPQAADVLKAYELTHNGVQQFISNTHSEWFATMEASVSKHLASCLLVQDRAGGETASRRQAGRHQGMLRAGAVTPC